MVGALDRRDSPACLLEHRQLRIRIGPELDESRVVPRRLVGSTQPFQGLAELVVCQYPRHQSFVGDRRQVDDLREQLDALIPLPGLLGDVGENADDVGADG